MKKYIKYIIIFGIMIILFCSTLTITALIPRNLLTKHIKESANILLKESNHLDLYILNKQGIISFDNYTDALMLNTAYSISPREPFYSSMVDRKNYVEGKTKVIYRDSKGHLKSASKYEEYDTVGELCDIANDDVTESFEYARYWHGYLIILRPLLVLFNIRQIRILLLILFGILGSFFLFNLYKKFDLPTAIIFLLGLVICDYFYIGLSLQGTSVFLIAIVSAIITLKRNVKDKNLMFFVYRNMWVTYTGALLALYNIIKEKSKENVQIQNIIDKKKGTSNE